MYVYPDPARHFDGEPCSILFSYIELTTFIGLGVLSEGDHTLVAKCPPQLVKNTRATCFISRDPTTPPYLLRGKHVDLAFPTSINIQLSRKKLKFWSYYLRRSRYTISRLNLDFGSLWYPRKPLVPYSKTPLALYLRSMLVPVLQIIKKSDSHFCEVGSLFFLSPTKRWLIQLYDSCFRKCWIRSSRNG